MEAEVEQVGRGLETPGWGQDYPGSFVSWWAESHIYKASLVMEEVVELMEDNDTLVVDLTTERWGGAVSVGLGGPTRSRMISRRHILHEEEQTWQGAEQVTQPIQWSRCSIFQVCISNGGHLATIESEEEFEIIESLIIEKLGFESDVWVGASDLEVNNEWRWTDGSPWNFTG